LKPAQLQTHSEVRARKRRGNIATRTESVPIMDQTHFVFAITLSRRNLEKKSIRPEWLVDGR
jgi:hypothetical protein